MARISGSADEIDSELTRGMTRSGKNNLETAPSHGYQINRLPSCAQSQNRTTVRLRFRRFSVVLLRRPCLALHRCALPVHLPPPPGNISACQLDDLGVANHKVASKRSNTPFRSIPAPREGAPAESRIHRLSRGRSGILLIKQF
jgi:hypothetical protein